MTHLSIKALRRYHELGLLEPVNVDPTTGYRSYDTGQVHTAQVIRRFRNLEMPVEQVKAVLTAPDLAARDALIVAHLKHMELQLEQTQSIVASLRGLLDTRRSSIAIEHRTIPRLLVASIAKEVFLPEIEPWWSDSFAAIYEALRGAGVGPAGPSGGLYPTELFTDEFANVLLYVPISDRFAPSGEVRIIELPSVELAIAVHEGSLREADRTYGPLGTHVADRAIGIDGPIREHYLVTDDDTIGEDQLRTEIGWPITSAIPAR
jgi:DNA-binding transcriptional MerR regulator